MSSPPQRLDSFSTELGRLRQLREDGGLTVAQAEAWAARAARAFMDHYAATGEGLDPVILALSELATLPDEGLARAGATALFSSVVEPLADAFDPAACRAYNRLFAQVIQFCRARPEGAPLDRALTDFDLRSERDLLDRIARISQVSRLTPDRDALEKVLVLSRVTLGADVAVTSVVLDTMKRLFPSADLVFLASEGPRQLFAGDPVLRMRPVGYARGGGLVGRLKSWLAVLAEVQEELRGLDPRAYLVVDPDSRLTQLGLLPLTKHDSRYCFFESRSYQRPGAETLGELTARWLGEMFGENGAPLPYVCPHESETRWARDLVTPLRQAGHNLVSVNLGVGENPEKRIPPPFEEDLLRSLGANGATVILDCGIGEEVERVGGLAERLAREGHRVVTATERSPEARAPLVITWHGGAGRLAAVIRESDLYIGYDSAGQHIAAALGVPAIDIFAGFTSPRMPVRWRPYGRGPVSMITVPNRNATPPRQILGQVLDLYQNYRARARG